MSNGHEHHTVLSQRALRNPVLPELRTKDGFAFKRRRERIRRIRQRSQPELTKLSVVVATQSPKLHPASLTRSTEKRPEPHTTDAFGGA
jgi:hypothetical protein